jgi:hypothetical protein
MAYSDSSIIIHLVKDTTTLALDDTVRIVKNLEDSAFELTFKDNGDPLTHKVYEMTRDNVCDYVYLLLKNLSLDEDGYQNIQLSLPAMPRMIITASKLQDLYYREHFLELIENSLSMLDKVEKLSIKKPVEKNTACNNLLPTCSNHHCSHPAYRCNDKSRNDWPELPKSPIHSYFE